MNRRIAKGILYVVFGTVFTPMVLADHPIFRVIQAVALTSLGLMNIVAGIRALQSSDDAV